MTKEYCQDKSFKKCQVSFKKWKEHNVDVRKSITISNLYKLGFYNRVLKINPIITTKQK